MNNNSNMINSNGKITSTYITYESIDESDSGSESKKMKEEAIAYEIGVIGAGFSGLYFAYRMLQHYPEYKGKIAIFEKTDRVGGRIYTENRYGFNMEYGPMRFEPDLQTKFAGLLEELDIETIPFPAYANPGYCPDYNKLELEEIQAIEFNKDLPPIFALMKHGLKKILGSQWNIDHDDISNHGRIADKKLLKQYGRFNGRLLRDIGLWDAFSQVLSKEAIDFMMAKGTFYHLLEENPNAAEQTSFILDVLATMKGTLVTIKNGSFDIIAKLQKLVEGRVVMKLKSSLKSFANVRSPNASLIRLKFEEEEDVLCKHLVFTCPKAALQNINGFSPEISALFNSIQNVQLFKIFIVLNNPPWTKDKVPLPNTHSDKIPCREIQYYSDSTGSYGMIMIYGDVPSINYWKPFLNSSNLCVPEFDSNEYLKEKLFKYLQIMFPERFPKYNILHYGIIDWSETSYGAAIHLWKPKYSSEDVGNILSSFGSEGNLHVCGEAFSDYQGFIEGCIRTTDSVITKLKKSI